MKLHYLLFMVMIILIFTGCSKENKNNELPRIIVSTDIGGSDPDDYQSMVHLLVYADKFNIEGLVSSPPYEGRKDHILEVIDAYETDYDNLKTYAPRFPAPQQLRDVTRQGAIDVQEEDKPTEVSEGAALIIDKALDNSDQSLYILVWGSITDVAQAVHANPEIKENIRIYSIGSWNTRQDEKARDYLYNNHKDLWWIENNTTFRGMYMGGLQDEGFDNDTFVEEHIKGHGALGDLFWEKKKDIKMGDTPSVLYFLYGNPNQPESLSWGGSFVNTPHSPHYWTDNPVDSLIENGKAGAKTVNVFRKDYLEDWAERMDWTLSQK